VSLWKDAIAFCARLNFTLKSLPKY